MPVFQQFELMYIFSKVFYVPVPGQGFHTLFNFNTIKQKQFNVLFVHQRLSYLVNRGLLLQYTLFLPQNTKAQTHCSEECSVAHRRLMASEIGDYQSPVVQDEGLVGNK
jgi:hypothetical protein